MSRNRIIRRLEPKRQRTEKTAGNLSCMNIAKLGENRRPPPAALKRRQ